jgi:hydroxymethylpyrimidine pyrophosphatase-like HAD family hydrolase
MKIEKKMFVTDLDGTLFTDEKIIHEKDLVALESLAREGITRVFATGRSLYSFQKAIQAMGFSSTCNDMPVDYVIFSTGAGIMECTHGEIIKKESLGTKDVALISECFDALGLDYMIHRPVPDTRYFIYKKGCLLKDGQNGYKARERLDKIPGHCNAHGHVNAKAHVTVNPPPQGGHCFDQGHGKKMKNQDFHARIALYQEFCRPMNKTEGADFGESTEILAIVPPCFGHEAANRVQQALKEFSVIKATSPLDGKSMWIEVFPPQVSKSQSVAWLSTRLGVDRKNVFSIGNDYNDLDLLEWSGRGFVVDNAPEDVKRGFEAVASNNRCGVAEVICEKMGGLIPKA